VENERTVLVEAMRLIDQLILANKPPAPTPPEEKKKTWVRNNKNANVAKSEQAWARYSAAIGTEWTGTTTVESRLKTNQGVASKMLMLYYGRGWLDRRPAGGGKFNRRKGWEWKCVK
jgi:hypothetical protein